jgi:hypothetical protein
MFVPLVGAINSLTQETPATANVPWMVLYPWLAPVAALVLAIVTGALCVRGLTRDQQRRFWWGAMVFVVAMTILIDAGILFVAPKFAMMFRDVLK